MDWLSSEIFDVEVLHDTVYLATAGGIQFFPQGIETRNSFSPVSLIAAVRADDSDIALTNKTKKPLLHKNITIQPARHSIKSDGSFTHRYRLLPADTLWITVSANENIVRFSALPPGNYTLKSRVVNEDGVMSKEAAVFKFRIYSKPLVAAMVVYICCYIVSKRLYCISFSANALNKPAKTNCRTGKIKSAGKNFASRNYHR